VTRHCLDVVATRNNCFALGQNYSTLNNFALVNLGLAVAMPALLGLVLGAPLVAREIEQGTNRLAWTQSITRTRWLLVKLGVGALACCAIVGAMAPLLEWWTGVIHRGARILPSLFDISGFVAVSYVLFAFMLGAVWARSSVGPDGPSRWEFLSMRSPGSLCGTSLGQVWSHTRSR